MLSHNKLKDETLYLEASKIAVVPNVSMYHRFLNWMSGEFELYLQDDSNGLKVYFPSGCLSVRLIQSIRADVYFEIHVKSKNKFLGTQMHRQALSVLDQIYKFEKTM
ncbi:hypothetical protein [Pseudotamlana carrageenivorans]|uniref:Uncharacterized protein n=1 Tax=Pseudotamlana carrageenivorans TaxID=2069432 RepID=A0A2I7SKX0_9FLAO|nr:hypothetical protein [Tamlana carrageenivorans]AUS06561.1 hypothetical protein C1A40_14435 [Tamlana carrageenivorans]